MSTSVFVMLISGAVLVGIGLIAGLVFLIFRIVQLIDGSKGGWLSLSKTYAAIQPPGGTLTKRLTLKIGAGVYKRCVSMGVCTEGLYLAIWRKSALIPWSEFKSLEKATLYWQSIPMITIGEPPVATLTVPVEVFQLFRTYLPEELRWPIP